MTVRSDEKGRKILDAHPDTPKESLSYVIVDDIAQDGAFNDVSPPNFHLLAQKYKSPRSTSYIILTLPSPQAVQSTPPFNFVIHTASPFHLHIQDPIKDLLDPAIKGTTGILTAIKAHAPTVKRVVITSSSATIINPFNHAKVYDETIWGITTWEEAMNPRLAYRASKVSHPGQETQPLDADRLEIYAERAAWEFIETEAPAFDLAVINPPLVFGPVARSLPHLDALNTSNHRIRDLIRGTAAGALPPTGPVFLWVDVRDAARAHVRAIEVPAAGRQRFFVVAGHFSNKRIADIIRESHPEMASKLPPEDAADDMPADVYGFDNKKSREVLGLEYRDLKTCVDDAVQSMMEVGV